MLNINVKQLIRRGLIDINWISTSSSSWFLITWAVDWIAARKQTNKQNKISDEVPVQISWIKWKETEKQKRQQVGEENYLEYSHFWSSSNAFYFSRCAYDTF